MFHHIKLKPTLTMCFTRKTKRAYQKNLMNKKKTKYQIYPLPKPSFTPEEVIQCKGCNDYFPLISYERDVGIQINCAGCDRFFHCQIAGSCKGPHCNRSTSIGVKHHVSWCVNCVPEYAINKEKQTRGESCVCHECLGLDTINRKF